jgi:hypothetical protein
MKAINIAQGVVKSVFVNIAYNVSTVTNTKIY